MRIYLDDIRDAPIGMRLCRTAEEAIDLIASGKVSFISFDHDLGTWLTGYDVACYIERTVANGKIRCPAWRVHSANPIGRDNIMRAMQSAKRFT